MGWGEEVGGRKEKEGEAREMQGGQGHNGD